LTDKRKDLTRNPADNRKVSIRVITLLFMSSSLGQFPTVLPGLRVGGPESTRGEETKRIY